MKRTVYIILIAISLIVVSNAKALIITSVPDVNSCPNRLLIVPVVVQDLENVNSITLHLDYNTLNGLPATGVLSYVGFQNMHPSLNNLMSVSNSGNTVVMSYYHPNGLVNITHDTLVEIRFYYTTGSSELNWVTGGVSKYWGYTCGNLPATFVNGSVSISGYSPVITSHPVDSTVYEGDECRFTVSAQNPVNYSWKVSTNGGFTWQNLADTAAYSGTHTNELVISNASLYMDNYYYRCYVTGACQPYKYSNPALFNVRAAIHVSIPDMVVCNGGVIASVNIEEFISVSEFFLELDYDSAILSFDSIGNVNSALSSGQLNVVDSIGRIYFSWQSSSPVTIISGTLFDLEFNSHIGDTITAISWNNNIQGACYFKDNSNTEISAMYINGNIELDECETIGGVVHYDNSASLFVDGVKVLLSRNNTPVDSILTDSCGYFILNDVLPGSYEISAYHSGSWDGVNAADALMIARHFAGVDTISGLCLSSADVDCSGFVNTNDALMVMKRFVGMISSFPLGDMVFTTDTVIIHNTSIMNLNISGLYSGDVNASYLPFPLTFLKVLGVLSKND
jgi:hypothetical protein